jgi:hypothetical protein
VLTSNAMAEPEEERQGFVGRASRMDCPRTPGPARDPSPDAHLPIATYLHLCTRFTKDATTSLVPDVRCVWCSWMVTHCIINKPDSYFHQQQGWHSPSRFFTTRLTPSLTTLKFFALIPSSVPSHVQHRCPTRHKMRRLFSVGLSRPYHLASISPDLSLIDCHPITLSFYLSFTFLPIPSLFP